MGMFDEVRVACPHCSTPVHIQSKSGKCEQRKFHQSAVPAAIAAGLHNHTTTCPSCLGGIRVRMNAPLMVPLVAVPLGSEAEDQNDPYEEDTPQ